MKKDIALTDKETELICSLEHRARKAGYCLAILLFTSCIFISCLLFQWMGIKYFHEYLWLEFVIFINIAGYAYLAFRRERKICQLIRQLAGRRNDIPAKPVILTEKDIRLVCILKKYKDTDKLNVSCFFIAYFAGIIVQAYHMIIYYDQPDTKGLYLILLGIILYFVCYNFKTSYHLITKLMGDEAGYLLSKCKKRSDANHSLSGSESA